MTPSKNGLPFWLWPTLAVLAIAGFFSLLPEPELQTTSQTEPAPQRLGSDNTTNSFVIGPVEIFDGEQFSTALKYVEIEDGKISRISAQNPAPNKPLVNTNGQTLLPGLIDAHVHAFGDALTRQSQYGVTTVLDMFTQPAVLQAAKPLRSETSQSNQADLWSAGILATAPKGHGTEYGMQIPVITGPEQALEFVKARKAEGSDYLKIVYQSAKAPRRLMPSIDQATLIALVNAAHAEQMLAVVHIQDQQSALDAARAGADGLVHGFFESRIQDALLTELKNRDIFVIPTMAVHEAMSRHTANEKWLLNDSRIALDAVSRSNLAKSFSQFNIPASLYDNMMANTAAMQQHGIRLLAGTDAPNPGTAHGISLSVELLLLQEAGLSVEAALRAATSLPATEFSLPERGFIKIGMRADLLLVENGHDLLTLTRPLQVWKNGYARLGTEPTQASTAKALTLGTLADFSQSEMPTQGLAVSATSDEMMHGSSVAKLTWHSDGYVQVHGNLSMDSQFPWAGVSYLPGASFEQGANFQQGSSISFDLRISATAQSKSASATDIAAAKTAGAASTQIQLMIFTNGSMQPELRTLTINDTWQSHSLKLSELSQTDTSQINMILWSAKQPGNFSFDIDNIKLQH
ncbi:MAG: amidohydrolase family protein [Gammaproteobacteria bacterium]|nr:amidohydrolase family protein [Gammaproteobacteria bacterium]